MLELCGEVQPRVGKRGSATTVTGEVGSGGTSESLLREIAELIEYHEHMASLAADSDDDLLSFLLPPKFEAWLIRYRGTLPAR